MTATDAVCGDCLITTDKVGLFATVFNGTGSTSNSSGLSCTGSTLNLFSNLSIFDLASSFVNQSSMALNEKLSTIFLFRSLRSMSFSSVTIKLRAMLTCSASLTSDTGWGLSLWECVGGGGFGGGEDGGGGGCCTAA